MQPPRIPPASQPQGVVVQQKSGCGKAVLILGGIAIILCVIVGGCFVMGMVGLDEAYQAAKKKESLQATPIESQATSPQVAPIPWPEIEQTYALNSKATDIVKDEMWKAYKGKRVQWTGTVVEVTKGFGGSYTVSVQMKPETLTSDVLVKLRKDQVDAAFKLAKGDKIRYEATLVAWGSLLPITAEDGVIFPPEK